MAFRIEKEEYVNRTFRLQKKLGHTRQTGT